MEDYEKLSYTAKSIILAWTALLKDYTGSVTYSFALTSTVAHTALPKGAKTIGVVLKDEQGLADLWQQIEGQLDSDSTTEENTPSLSLQSHIHVEQKDSNSCDDSDASKKDADKAMNARFTHGRADVDIYIRCSEHDADFEIRVDSTSSKINSRQITRMHYQLLHAFQQIRQPLSNDQLLHHISTASGLDLEQIWLWNDQVKPTSKNTVLDIFSAQVENNPEAIAIDAWDGKLRYDEVDHLSTALAHQLLEAGVQGGQIIPLCFEKCVWTAVAILAVIKTGAVFVLMDESLPHERLRQIIQEIGQSLSVLVSSATQLQRAEAVHSTVVVVDSRLRSALSSDPPLLQTRMELSDCVYICFTSGSTGVPKGAMIQHTNICAYVDSYAPISGVSRHSRILVIASYAFDISIGNIFMGLMSGACICFPSSWECKNDVPSLISRYQGTHLQTTPSMSMMLDPLEAPTLQVLDLCGEPCRRDSIDRWQHSATRVMNSYGPAECMPTSVVNFDISQSPRPSIIGKGLGCCWIVDPMDSTRLIAIGGVGELVLEGPQVGLGYLHDTAKTQAAYIEDPEWLVSGYPNVHQGRHGRVYRTGDLVRYTCEGEIEFMGRRDYQVKIRGQRVELGEIAAHLQKLIPDHIQWCLEVAKIRNGTEQLIIFVVSSHEDRGAIQQTLHEVAARVHWEAIERLPTAMVPSVYASISRIPLSPTGKMDRRRLRQLALSLSPGQTFFPQALSRSVSADDDNPRLTLLHNENGPSGELEEFSRSMNDEGETQFSLKLNILKQLWSEVFHIDAALIHPSDTFFGLGGESLLAIKLVGLAAGKGLRMDVPLIFRHSQLHQQASVCDFFKPSQLNIIPPFSLLKDKKVVQELAKACFTTTDNIEDAYPCTPMQEGLVVRRPGQTATYTGRAVLKLPQLIDPERLEYAWQHVAQAYSIMRTRIVDTTSNGMLQVVLKDGNLSTTDTTSSLIEHLQRDDTQKMGLRTKLCRWSVVQESASTSFVLTMHHSIYDGWAIRMIASAVFKAYQGIYIQPSLCFNQFIDYLNMLPLASAQRYWSDILKEPTSTTFFPPVSSTICQVQADATISRTFKLPANVHGVSVPSLLRASWALLVAQFSGSQDVTFGATVSGRNVSISGIERLVGPTISTVPVRVKLEDTETVHEYVERIQNEALEAIPFENLGLQNIRKISPYTRQGSAFNTLLVVQPSKLIIPDPLPGSGSAEHELKTLLLEELNISAALSNFNEYALLMSIETEGRCFTVEASYDSRVLETAQTELLLAQFAHIIAQLGSKSHMSTKIKEVPRISDNDLGLVWEWNSVCFNAEQRFIHHVIADSILSYPEAQAVCSWDGSFTYEELDTLSTRLAQKISRKGLNPHHIVPICMEKTKWVTVAMLGILKAGAGFVTMDARNHPERRLKNIISEVGARCIVTAGQATQLAHRLSDEVIACGDMAFFEDGPFLSNDMNLPSSPSDTAFIVFTSGSTGVPKGIIITHENFCSTISYHISKLKLSNTSRVYDYASYSFDIAIHNALMTLAVGGCLCVPSEIDRENDIDTSFEQLHANWTDITPSVARLMDPSAVPSLKTLVLSGEPVGQDLVRRWVPQVDLINAYGPAETQICTIQTQLSSSSDSTNIGRGVACSTWIVDPQSDALLPIGAVGELLIEGPIVSPGYLNAPCDAFLESPVWLTCGFQHVPGRSGRLYRTGDLVRYRPDGTIVYLDRANAQTKINGQRIELGEIEFHLREALPAVPDLAAEAIIVNGISHVCAFLVQTTSENPFNDPKLKKGAELSIKPMASPPGLYDILRGQLPGYMVPAFFWEISHMPLTPTCKTDRKKLRAAMSDFSAEDILSMPMEGSSDENFHLNEQHLNMIRLWSHILKLEPMKIGPESNFFRLGGDSLSAMTLVKSARKENIYLTVQDVFLHPRLEELCSVSFWSCGEVVQFDNAHDLSQSFDMLPLNKRDMSITAAAASCNLSQSEIVDMYPCSPFQEAVFTQTANNPHAYVQHLGMKLNHGSDINRLIAAWNATIASHAILRTRIVQTDRAQLLQVVIRGSDQQWPVYESSSAYLESFSRSPMCFGSSLSRLAIIHEDAEEYKIIWTIHHALYDAWTVKLLLHQVSEMTLSRKTLDIGPQYKVFVKFLSFQRAESEHRWKLTLDGASSAAVFPKYHSDTSRVSSNSTHRKDIHIPSVLPLDYTTATLLRTAWGLLMVRHSSGNSVIFGEMRFGRSVPVQGIEEIRGPTIAPVPVLMQTNPDQTIGSLLDENLAKYLYTQNHEHLGLHNIARLSEDAKAACNFQTILVIQEDAKDNIGHAELELDYGIDDVRNFNSWSLMIIFHRKKRHVEVEAVFDDLAITSTEIDCLLQQLENICTDLSTLDPSSMIHRLDRCSKTDLEQIWKWNSQVPVATDVFMDELVAKQAQEHPNDVAITAHDGEYTYQQLDTLSSQLAMQLIRRGIGAGALVALCFEKSSLVPIAMLAVLKVDATFTVMDVISYPKRRLAEISKSLGIHIAISSPRQRKLSQELVDNVLTIDRSSLVQLGQPTSLDTRKELERDTDRVMYICFTSGSSGTPKGVMISHKNLASALVIQTFKLGFGPGDRFYDFSSHAFDMHIWSTWQALVSGACVCIPSDEDRVENLASSMGKFGSTVAWLTPSVARTIDPRDVPTIKRLFLGGEPVLANDISLWMSHVDLFETYGPAETTPLCMFVQPHKPESAGNIGTGRGFGVNPWICNPHNHNELIALGAVGELALEGPLVGLGYHNQVDLTMNAFVEDPSFLIQGCESSKGRFGRLYKTGDLARYLFDGSIQYEGRANTQAKLRGQRMDFGEIEHHLMNILTHTSSVICELITESSGRQRLIAFCSLTVKTHALDTARARLELSKLLPSYMIPEAFVIVNEIPRNLSGKANRRYLQTEGFQLMQNAEQMELTDPLDCVYGPLTQMETRLQELWNYTLNQDTFYSLKSDFLKSGGDSIEAMKLSNLARKHCLSLPVKSITENSSLSAMALEISPIKASWDAPRPFSLIKGNRTKILTKAATICHISTSLIVDIYPCTPLQTELFALSLKQPDAYMKISVFRVPDHLDYSQVVQAWNRVIDVNPILRTQFVEIGGEGLLQVVSKSNKVGISKNLDTYLATNPAQSSLGTPLSRVVAIPDSTSPKVVWAIHHALYDGWSIQIIEEQLCKAYLEQKIPRPPEYSSFVNHILSQDLQKAKGFWAQRLVDCKSSAIYPALPSATYQVLPTRNFKRTLSVRSSSNRNLQIVLLAAWAYIASDLCGNDDVVFGSTFAGRNSSIQGIESLVGPTITPLPVRVKLKDRNQSVQGFLDQIKQEILEMEPYQHIGNKAIKLINEDTWAACKYQTLIVVSSPDSSADGVKGLSTSTYEIDSKDQAFHTFGLVMFVKPTPNGLSLEVIFDPNLFNLHEIERLGGRLETTISTRSQFSSLNKPLSHISCLGQEDLRDIWSWNASLPANVNKLLHSIILDRAKTSNRTAIDACDCTLTYLQIDQLSQNLETHLRMMGVGCGSIVPILSTKSGYVPVAALAVLRTGAAFLPLDAAQPFVRLSSIIEQVMPKVILAAQSSFDVATNFKRKIVLIEKCYETKFQGEELTLEHLQIAQPEHLACILFTSGSTGTPKGVMQSHRALTSAVVNQAALSGFSEETRAFEFASYGFDVSWNIIFKTLAVGGTLCVPADEHRNNDLVGALNRSAATLTELTPSVARLINPAQLTSLKTLIMSGEPVDLREFQHWQPHIRLIVCYGPSECTSASTMNLDVLNTIEHNCIGTAASCVTWIADPQDHRRLMPIGSVGEILIEGPIVGMGYLNNKQLTDSAYVSDLPWLEAGYQKKHGRSSILFKSGDLARYDNLGNLHFVARKDTQVKIRGQRIELEEAQHHLRNLMGNLFESIVCCCFQKAELGNERVLAAFLGTGKPQSSDVCTISVPTKTAVAAVETSEERLRPLVPAYMIPSVYYFVNQIPKNTNGKVDRERLTALAKEAQVSQAYRGRSRHSTVRQGPLSEAEHLMQTLWMRALECSMEYIGLDADFFSLNGDSISAMKLVAIARDAGYNLRVSDVFMNPSLSGMALRIEPERTETHAVIRGSLPFEMLGESVNTTAIRMEIGAKCGVQDLSLIEDAYPCTPLQADMLAATLKDSHAFVSMRLYRIPQHTDEKLLRAAWSGVISRNSILRTRLVSLKDHGLSQVVIQGCSWNVYSDTSSFLNEATSEKMGLGTPLTRWAVIPTPDERMFVWQIHHAIYDGWMLSLIETELQEAYLGSPQPAQLPGIKPYVQFLLEHKEDSSNAFWQNELKGAIQSMSFPALPNHVYEPDANSFLERTIQVDLTALSAGTSLPAFIYSSWALLTSILTKSNKVMFGAIVTGRNAPVPDIEKIAGPTITTVPILVDIDPSQSIHDFTLRMRETLIRMINHEYLGTHAIRQISEETAAACNFKTVLVVQPPRASEITQVQPGKDSVIEEIDETKVQGFPDQHAVLNQYGLMLEILPIGCSIKVRASFDRALISSKNMERIVNQWEHLMKQFIEIIRDMSGTTIRSLDMLCECDLDDIWKQNEMFPMSISHELIHQSISKVAQMQPKSLAIDAWNGTLTYQELEMLSSRLAKTLVQLGVGPNCYVPLIFPKSLWANVAMLAVLKSGGAFVPFDADHPEGSLRAAMQSFKAIVILCSSETKDQAARLARQSLVVDSTLQNDRGIGTISSISDWAHATSPQKVEPDHVAYAVFTSGSTGAAKGVKISHRNLLTAIWHQVGASGLRVNSDTRSLDSSSYAFDACVFNFFYTVTSGGCFCIPNIEQLKGDLGTFMKDMKINWAQLVPSVARMLDPDKVPDLKDLILTGETLTQGDIETWGNRLRLINVYGPTECTILCSISSPLYAVHHARNIGKGKGANIWLTEIGDPSRLVPYGAIGEILIEGPIIGAGYLGPYQYPLVVDPLWLSQGSKRHAGRRGTVFRTGDQARYNEDGTLTLLGRIGPEIKLRGQRVDLVGIENFVRQCGQCEFDIAADIVFVNHGSNGQKREMLLLFAYSSKLGRELSPREAELEENLRNLAASLKQKLNTALPSYLHPEAFFPLAAMPRTRSGKLDRSQLKEIGKKVRLQQLIWISASVSDKNKSPPATPEENLIASLWAQVLNLPSESIAREDDFFILGADSLTVMNLATAAHDRGFLLNVNDVFKSSKLSELAKKMIRLPKLAELEDRYAPFDLLHGISDLQNFLKKVIAPALSICASQIEDIVPANGFQVDYMHHEEEPLGLQYAYLDISSEISWPKLIDAVRTIVQSFQSLRARFVHHEGKYYQVILQNAPLLVEEFSTDQDLTTFSTSFCPQDCRSAIVSDIMTKLSLVKTTSGVRRVILRVSHMQNDGWCQIRILHAIAKLYNGGQVSEGSSSWTKFLCFREKAIEGSLRYWHSLLQGTNSTTPALIYKPGGDKIRTLRTLALPNFHILSDNRRTRPTVIINVAWALVLQRLGGHDDVVFGNVTTGRNGSMPGLESIIGPCVNMLPTRLRVSEGTKTCSRKQLLRNLVEGSAQQVDERTKFEGLDWDHMTDHCTSWNPGVRQTSAVHFRNMAFHPQLILGNETLTVGWYELVATPYWTTVLVYPEEDVLRIWLLASQAQIGDEGADEILNMIAELAEEIISSIRDD